MEITVRRTENGEQENVGKLGKRYTWKMEARED